jgi:hypothetical protein
MDSRMRVSACGHRDHCSDTSSGTAAEDNCGVFPNPHIFLPDPDCCCGSNCLCVLAQAKSRRSKITLGVQAHPRS